MTKYDLKPEIKIKDVLDGFVGFTVIADQLVKAIRKKDKKQVILALEGYPGVNYIELKEKLFPLLAPSKIIAAEDYAQSIEQVQERIKDTITNDRVFGILSQFTIDQFYPPELIEQAKEEISSSEGLVIVYGMGTRLISQPDILVYADLSRWEIQCRYRKEGLCNWKTDNTDEDSLRKYKRGYFFEWPMADREKKRLFNKIDYLLDTTNNASPTMIDGKSYLAGLEQVARRPFRLVPFFDASVWGGQWMKEKFNLDSQVANYGWAFDGVPEENSIILNFNGTRVEVPGHNPVFTNPDELLGSKVRWRFGTNFPIRFDYLDTMQGGNLSLQVHPLIEYAQDKFGIHYTQDESYYILEATDDSTIYLGVKNGTNKEQLIDDLRKASSGDAQFPDEKYINIFPVKKHDHYAIPAGTIHCGGPNTVVLEISATPNNFTFKLWDWGRVGLDGIPRPVHIDHGEANILVERDTDYVLDNFVSKADGHFENISNQEGVRIEKTGLSDLQFIETRRYWFNESAILETYDSVNMLNLVDGNSIVVESLDEQFDPLPINYGETFIVPESVKRYRVRNTGAKKAVLLQAFVRNL